MAIRSWEHLAIDAASAAVAFVFVVPLSMRFEKRTWLPVVAPAAWLTATWLLISLVSIVFPRTLPVEPERFATLGPEGSVVATRAEAWRDLRIGLSLSGGGYRAAVFHAGTLQALEDLGIRVDNLSTVSGGSIIGTYYAAGGEPARFADAMAARRFDLKRELMLMHNALLLPLPLEVPILDIKLFPWCDFDRLDVQRSLLDARLFRHARLAGDSGIAGQPHLMIAATDMTYGFQLGLLPDGMLKLGDGVGGRDVYRGSVFEAEEEWSLAERVAVSGAFPIAFPSRPYRVRVSPSEATGRGVRELVLVDGGLRDNLGYDLLRVADSLADPEAEALGVGDERMGAEWDLDAILVSDGGMVPGVLEERGNSLSLLPRAFEVAVIDTFEAPTPHGECERPLTLPPRFSPTRMMLTADTQFNLKNDSDRRAALDNEWSIHFDPALYPGPILLELVGTIRRPRRAETARALTDYWTAWSSHRTVGRSWARALDAAEGHPACNEDGDRGAVGLLAGTCEALALRRLVRAAVIEDLEVFRGVSTLDDRLSRDEIETLERLGKLLVHLEWPALSRRLDEAAACAAAG